MNCLHSEGQVLHLGTRFYFFPLKDTPFLSCVIKISFSIGSFSLPSIVISLILKSKLKQKYSLIAFSFFSPLCLCLSPIPLLPSFFFFFFLHLPICVCLVTQSCLTVWDLMDYSPPASSCPWGFSRQEYWSGLPCPPLGDLSQPRDQTQIAVDPLLSEPPGKSKNTGVGSLSLLQGIS